MWWKPPVRENPRRSRGIHPSRGGSPEPSSPANQRLFRGLNGIEVGSNGRAVLTCVVILGLRHDRRSRRCHESALRLFHIDLRAFGPHMAPDGRPGRGHFFLRHLVPQTEPLSLSSLFARRLTRATFVSCLPLTRHVPRARPPKGYTRRTYAEFGEVAPLHPLRLPRPTKVIVARPRKRVFKTDFTENGRLQFFRHADWKCKLTEVTLTFLRNGFIGPILTVNDESTGVVFFGATVPRLGKAASSESVRKQLRSSLGESLGAVLLRRSLRGERAGVSRRSPAGGHRLDIDAPHEWRRARASARTRTAPRAPRAARGPAPITRAQAKVGAAST